MGTCRRIALYALLGFFLAPWLVKNTAIKSVRENLAAELRIGKVAINPFVLSLRIDGLELDDPSQARFARIDEIFVNFQSSSLFRWAWTFDEIRFTAPQLNLARDAAGTLNLAAFKKQTAEPATAPEPDQGEGGLPRLLIFNFIIDCGGDGLAGTRYRRTPWRRASVPSIFVYTSSIRCRTDPVTRRS